MGDAGPSPKKRWRKLRRALLVIGFGGVAWMLFLLAAIFHEGAKEETGNADAAIVLGAAVYGNRPSPVLEGRLEHALHLFEGKRVRWIILTGAKSAEDTVSESLAGKRYLVAHGVPPDAIAIEENSHTTVQNLAEAKKLMEQTKSRNAFVVSDPMHMLRCRLVWQRLKISAVGAPTRHSRYQSFWSKARFALRELVYLHGDWLLRK